jgi:hypothetical protein
VCCLVCCGRGCGHDTVSERLRRWTRNPLGSARRGSNPLGVVLWLLVVDGFAAGVLCKWPRQSSNLQSPVPWADALSIGPRGYLSFAKPICVCSTGVRICIMFVGFSVGVFCVAFALLCRAVPVSCAVVVCVCVPWPRVLRAKDTLAEWLRRRPAKPMGSPRVGSNPTGVGLQVAALRRFGSAKVGAQKRGCSGN